MTNSELRQLARTMPPADHPPTRDDYIAYLLSLGVSPSELYQELEMDRKYAQFQQEITEQGSVSRELWRLHSHPFYEIVYCRESGGVGYLVGTQRFALEPGDVLFVPPGVSHRPLPPEQLSGSYSRDVLWVSHSFMQQALPSLPDFSRLEQARAPLLRTQGTPWAAVENIFRWGVSETARSAPGEDAAITGCALVILSLLCRMSGDSRVFPPAVERYSLTEEILQYMEGHLSERITISQVAEYFYVSESTVAQNFRRKMGVSFYRYLTRRRLVAARLLIEQGVPLEKVSDQVGFPDYSCFYRAFRREYGISPREYRKEHIPPKSGR